MTRSRSSVLLFGASVGVAALAAPVAAAFAADASPPPPPAKTQAVVANAANASDAPADVMATMRKAFAELADSRADVRESARTTLMGMERRYLDDLRALVEHSRPLRPAQATALRQIVNHVYLSGETYEPDGHDAGFLGVRTQHIALTSAEDDDAVASPRPAPDNTGNGDVAGPVIPPGEGAAAATAARLPRVGMVVISRLPGFVAHRVLRDGDVILGIVERPELSFAEPRAFTNSIIAMKAGETFHLTLLRRGRVLKVELTLEHRPKIVNNDLAGEAFDRDRRAKADAYWREAFAPLLPDALD
jgi:hypothetical protein